MYSFHFKPDSWRAAQVRNAGVTEGNQPVSDNDWEAIKKGGDAAIKAWIDAQPRLGVASQLHFDDPQPAARFYRNEIRVTRAEADLAPNDHEFRITGQRQKLGGFLDQAVQGCLVRESDRAEDLPACTVMPPDCRHHMRLRDAVYSSLIG
jgi:hypothetical protein